MLLLKVSDAGVHRPPVAGIHGREDQGAYSIVSLGVYQEDKDYGDYFLYSGCGGKQSSKTKRLSPRFTIKSLRDTTGKSQ